MSATFMLFSFQRYLFADRFWDIQGILLWIFNWLLTLRRYDLRVNTVVN
ncbi:hypothetical protein [Nostoc sp.]